MDLGFYDMMDVTVGDFKKKIDNYTLDEFIQFEKDNNWKVEDLLNIKSCIVEENNNTVSTNNFNGDSPPT